ncbi:MAG: DNA (cytosine-5-)-methyltransferase [Gemmatimonas sp.]|uniref:DNA (cytosine-5-)-methyltransferase n=1 Tax=Gemmatimonas sp. TaxID=1962908 RepID=UPI00391F961F
MLTYAELFAGAGGLSMGLEAAGFHAVAHAEIEPHARAVLRYRWPDTRLDGDVTKVDGRDYTGVTLLSGGSPCQDLSVAGKRAGLGGARSSLFYEQVRIWNESGAPYLLWENVGGALSSNNGRDFAAVLGALVGASVDVPLVRGKPKWQRAGVASGPTAVAAWRVLDLQHFGPPQRRVRVFVLAARTGGVDPAEVLALGEGVCGHPSPRQQAREGIAGGAAGGAGGGGVIPIGEATARQGAAHGSSAMIGAPGDEMYTLTSKQHGVFAIGLDGEKKADVELIGTLNTGSKSGSGQQPAVLAFAVRGREGGGMAEVSEVSPSLRTPGGGSSHAHVLCTTGHVTHALTHEGADASEDGTGRGTPIVARMVAFGEYATDGTASTIKQRDYKDATDLVVGARPRRLTPLECERLMSWPDGWTRYGRKEDGAVYELSDTARYRLCGNGVGSVCVQWIAERLARAVSC